MFTKLERRIINRDFFTMSIFGSSVAELRSENGDWWMIMKIEKHLTKGQLTRGFERSHYFQLLHRHANAQGYHLHAEYETALDTVLDILNHDDYRMKRTGRTHFDELVEESAQA